MKKVFPFIFLALIVLFTACGPAAEDKQAMHARAKVFQDSIANMIRASMAEAESPAPVTIISQPTPAPTATAAPAPTQAPAPKK